MLDCWMLLAPSPSLLYNVVTHVTANSPAQPAQEMDLNFSLGTSPDPTLHTLNPAPDTEPATSN